MCNFYTFYFKQFILIFALWDKPKVYYDRSVTNRTDSTICYFGGKLQHMKESIFYKCFGCEVHLKVIQLHQRATLCDPMKFTIYWMTVYATIYNTFLQDIPVQVVPSPEKPELHAQVNDPAVFVQAALVSQLSVLRVHSLSSENETFSLLLCLSGILLFIFLIHFHLRMI
jgi:hypothetical protein